MKTFAFSIASRIAAALVLGVGLLLASAPAQAQLAAGSNYVLTPQIVENFISSYGPVRQRAEELGDENQSLPDDASPVDTFSAYLGAQGAMNELNGVTNQYGFSDFHDWLNAMSAIVSAYTFVQDGGGMDAQMAQAIAQVQNNPNMTQQQKDAILAQLGVATQSINAMRPSQENLDAVTPYANEIETMLEND